MTGILFQLMTIELMVDVRCWRTKTVSVNTPGKVYSVEMLVLVCFGKKPPGCENPE
jgi:hypothetical protein